MESGFAQVENELMPILLVKKSIFIVSDATALLGGTLLPLMSRMTLSSKLS